MTRPTLFRWTMRWFWGGLIVVGGFTIGLTVVNVVDAFPFWLAWRRAHRLEATELRALAEACTRYEKQGHLRWSGGEKIPPEFHALKPLQVDVYPGSSDLTLFDRIEYVYMFVRVSTRSGAQRIECVAYGAYGQKRDLLWQSAATAARESDPADRLITVTEDRMRSGREWIVRPQEILVISSASTVGGAPAVAHFPLTVESRAEIKAAISDLGSGIRGHAFDGGAVDGIVLRVAFPPTAGRIRMISCSATPGSRN